MLVCGHGVAGPAQLVFTRLQAEQWYVDGPQLCCVCACVHVCMRTTNAIPVRSVQSLDSSWILQRGQPMDHITAHSRMEQFVVHTWNVPGVLPDERIQQWSDHEHERLPRMYGDMRSACHGSFL